LASTPVLPNWNFGIWNSGSGSSPRSFIC
jgi:hypothetical protein